MGRASASELRSPEQAPNSHSSEAPQKSLFLISKENIYCGPRLMKFLGFFSFSRFPLEGEVGKRTIEN